MISKLCFYEGCKKKINITDIQCNYCNEIYCLKHRLPEQHECRAIIKCKSDAHERNKVKLLDEKIKINKISSNV